VSCSNLAVASTTQSPPLASCIIIFFNPGAAFLHEAIESVLTQTYPNWELLLCDDG
jgi:glycosyltransferase involved in cell wall biosynthesis